MGQGVVHVLWAYDIKLRVPDAVLLGKQEGEKLYKGKKLGVGGERWNIKPPNLSCFFRPLQFDSPQMYWITALIIWKTC